MGNDWESLFDADIDDEGTDKAVSDSEQYDADETETEIDDIEEDNEQPVEDEAKPKKGLFKKKEKPVKKSGKKASAEKKPEKPAKAKTVHGLKRKETTEDDPYARRGSSHGKLVFVGIGVAVLAAAIGVGGFVANKRVQTVSETNQNLTQQIANRTKNVYTAKRDILIGDEIITTGSDANVELSQVYTSLADSAYISESTSGYAQVNITSGMPVMADEVGDSNPVVELDNAVEEAVAPYLTAKVMPYKITAEYVDLETGNALADERDLLLDNGANEKAFNTEAETIDGYKLSTIKVDGESVHAYGMSEKSMKGGIVSMYYYTTKGGWGRHEMKGNIRVIYGYVKQADAADIESDVFDDSAWIDMEEANTEADSADIAENTIEDIYEEVVDDTDTDIVEGADDIAEEITDTADTEVLTAE